MRCTWRGAILTLFCELIQGIFPYYDCVFGQMHITCTNSAFMQVTVDFKLWWQNERYYETSATIASNAAAGSSALVIGRPITMCEAPFSNAWAGVAVRL